MSVARFWREQQQRYNLVGTRCSVCSGVYFPARHVCPKCRRDSVGKVVPHPLSRRGTVVTWTTVHEPAPGFELETPYVMAIVALEEGPRLTTQIVDCEPADVAKGMAVEACFRRIREDGRAGVIYYGYKFRPMRVVQ